MANAVESFGQVNSSDNGTRWRFPLVETNSNFGDQGSKGRDGGSAWGKAMLEGRASKMGKNEGANQAFKKFRGRAKQGNRSEGGTKVRGFARFKDREDEGLFPKGREVSRAKGEVEEVSQERNSKRAKVFEVKVGERIGT